MSFVAVVIGGWAFREWDLDLGLFAAALVWAIFTASANMANDVFDAQEDATNHPERPIPKGEIRSSLVLLAAFLFIMPALLLAALVSLYLLILVVGCLVLLYAYEKWLKRLGLLGNLAVGLLVGCAFVAGGLVMDNFYVGLLIGFVAFLANTGREIVKDMEDMAGDTSRKTFVKSYGPGAAIVLADFFFISPVVFAVLIFVPLGYGNFLYIGFIALSGLAFLAAVISVRLNPKFSQQSAKMGMVLALAAFLFG
jgi:geranylgeranylglycerol-phosphate geranylgeranyltransferase